jgi:hypothetical protein
MLFYGQYIDVSEIFDTKTLPPMDSPEFPFKLFDYQKDIIKELQMGVNYTQHCMLGFYLDADDITVIRQPAIYDEQPRYDTRTGKQTHTEKVLVKQEEAVYQFEDLEDEYLEELGEQIADKYGVGCRVDQEYEFLCVGIDVAESADYGRVDLLNDDIDIKSLLQEAEELKEKFPQYKDQIGLHFFSYVG